jgi:hypothetical protein
VKWGEVKWGEVGVRWILEERIVMGVILDKIDNSLFI